MIVEMKIPSPGESITEVEIAQWLVSDGDYVEKDQEIAEVESDKATLPLIAEESGIIKILTETGRAIGVGTVACTIDTDGKAPKTQKGDTSEAKEETGKTLLAAEEQKQSPKTEKPAGKSGRQVMEESEQSFKEDAGATVEDSLPEGKKESSGYDRVKISPLARKLMENEGFSINDIINGLQRISREDVAALVSNKETGRSTRQENEISSREAGRQKMSMLRRNLSKRLVAVKNETAMLTTFNEVDMSEVISVRKKYQSRFTEKHAVKLGFMSFFVKAATEALKLYTNVNSYIDGEDIVTPQYHDIGIAVQTEKGLMVPVIRNTETLGLAGIEKKILELAEKARKNRISIDDMTGGSFTITNGGVFGSLLSTPILNPPQSGILGMHNIVERPVAIEGKVEIRPMMYIALSYDHRIIDGRDSVGFLVKIKQMLENPVTLLSGGADPVSRLLEI